MLRRTRVNRTAVSPWPAKSVSLQPESVLPSKIGTHPSPSGWVVGRRAAPCKTSSATAVDGTEGCGATTIVGSAGGGAVTIGGGAAAGSTVTGAVFAAGSILISSRGICVVQPAIINVHASPRKLNREPNPT